MLLGEKIGGSKEGLERASSQIQEKTEEVQAEISRWENGESMASVQDGLVLAKSLSKGMEQLVDSTSVLTQTLDDIQNKFMQDQEAGDIYKTLHQAIDALEPGSFEDLQQQIRKLTESHQQKLDQLNHHYETARNAVMEALPQEEGQDGYKRLATLCAELQIETGWSVALEENLGEIKGLPENPASEFSA